MMQSTIPNPRNWRQPASEILAMCGVERIPFWRFPAAFLFSAPCEKSHVWTVQQKPMNAGAAYLRYSDELEATGAQHKA